MDPLPVEIWCSIFRRLDPVGLTAASQACREFRQIIQPSRAHFVERLLALECQSRDEAWTRMRWTCAGCMRLLPDSAFDNHSLLRLGYRKPTPGTPSSRAVSSWEPSANNSLLRNHRKWKSQNRESLRAQEKRVRKQYGLAHTWNWGIRRDELDPLERLMLLQDAGLTEFAHCGLGDFQGMGRREECDIVERAAAAIEAERTGFRRHLRRCNECHWQRGEMRVHPLSIGDGLLRHAGGPNIGTSKLPIARSRQILLSSALDRWFPGWSSALEGEESLAANKPPETERPGHSTSRSRSRWR
ncbi:hypothetical protein PG994_008485 [Apiospora phragmitis]|uniref:F-box domain-containing protein n=1 Tax=Apiospora phragmitis TaxID=2905665 RepID=A0ABR1UGJ4_9PEZI